MLGSTYNNWLVPIDTAYSKSRLKKKHNGEKFGTNLRESQY